VLPEHQLCLKMFVAEGAALSWIDKKMVGDLRRLAV
jgi:hypothetical protein